MISASDSSKPCRKVLMASFSASWADDLAGESSFSFRAALPCSSSVSVNVPAENLFQFLSVKCTTSSKVGVEELGQLWALEAGVQVVCTVQAIDLGCNKTSIVVWSRWGRTLGRDGNVGGWQGVVSESGVGSQEVEWLERWLRSRRNRQLGSKLNHVVVFDLTNSHKGQIRGHKLLAQERLQIHGLQSGQSVGLTVGWQGKGGSLECGGNHVLDDHRLRLGLEGFGESGSLCSLVFDVGLVFQQGLEVANKGLDGLESLLVVTLGEGGDGQSGDFLGVGRADLNTRQRVGFLGSLGRCNHRSSKRRNTRIEWVLGSGTRVQVQTNR
ncbi:hypothetical protein OGATHE_002018 [Ogataea polymorpha]|uniref:Uncharacterized protein n=1 Tax=Ogataea polymorpha TaxID=460523 RepID=A0A9P8PKM7_9ASCO|nr:hypothetical protein OGATHE_002018 [Ogataea polymorpha]